MQYWSLPTIRSMHIQDPSERISTLIHVLDTDMTRLTNEPNYANLNKRSRSNSYCKYSLQWSVRMRSDTAHTSALRRVMTKSFKLNGINILNDRTHGHISTQADICLSWQLHGAAMRSSAFAALGLCGLARHHPPSPTDC